MTYLNLLATIAIDETLAAYVLVGLMIVLASFLWLKSLHSDRNGRFSRVHLRHGRALSSITLRGESPRERHLM